MVDYTSALARGLQSGADLSKRLYSYAPYR